MEEGACSGGPLQGRRTSSCPRGRGSMINYGEGSLDDRGEGGSGGEKERVGRKKRSGLGEESLKDRPRGRRTSSWPWERRHDGRPQEGEPRRLWGWRIHRPELAACAWEEIRRDGVTLVGSRGRRMARAHLR